jgi:16S rRNA (adenine1518-N6/adenine1519-N6)-dimethyltransferase
MAGDGHRRPKPPPDRGRPPRPAPLRRYGQNHLVDANVLAAIVKQADVRPDDVVLEVGAADGLLTRPLLERARLVHAFEVDRRFSGRLERLAAEEPGLRLHVGDALKARLDELDPVPTALVANLAYNIAIPLVMTTVAEVPSVSRWAVMLQKELGERLFAAPGTKAYAAVSVLTQLACELERARPVARSAFRPRPNVDSAFVTFTRRAAAANGTWHVGAQRLDRGGYAVVGGLVRRAFAQRRKQLGTSLSGAAHGAPAAPPAGEPGAAALAGHVVARADIARALETAGASVTARPEELAPAQWLTFARALGWLAPA